jgi:hypothetical protein
MAAFILGHSQMRVIRASGTKTNQSCSDDSLCPRRRGSPHLDCVIHALREKWDANFWHCAGLQSTMPRCRTTLADVFGGSFKVLECEPIASHCNSGHGFPLWNHFSVRTISLTTCNSIRVITDEPQFHAVTIVGSPQSVGSTRIYFPGRVHQRHSLGELGAEGAHRHLHSRSVVLTVR